MFSAKTYSLAGIAAAALIYGTLPGYSATDGLIRLAQEQAEPAADTAPASPEEQQPAAGDAAPDAAPEPEGGDAAAPAQESQEHAPADGSSETHDNAATPEPAAEAPATEAPAAEAPAAASSDVDASHLKIGAAVFGSDGVQIGEVNGVKTDTAGKVREILVTAGTAAGLNAQVYAVPGDKITEVNEGVKLSLTSEEAKQLPIVDNSNG